ncbi:hypothetical protein CERZMDRAFT_92430 [Cercospora zeae-maydis SCOH1-5]|uniref:Uncharacterized protein n=1 Tax=Cercospora zeae-maydis SCOH1-5 TaxID=717836 RepID=A0A6A6FX30_9PEZI|nr:hypothetical protein CERZMDRAFT_92430 [Cercospora zeae-maydis SCOH1-5]
MAFSEDEIFCEPELALECCPFFDTTLLLYNEDFGTQFVDQGVPVGNIGSPPPLQCFDGPLNGQMSWDDRDWNIAAAEDCYTTPQDSHSPSWSELLSEDRSTDTIPADSINQQISPYTPASIDSTPSNSIDISIVK